MSYLDNTQKNESEFYEARKEPTTEAVWCGSSALLKENDVFCVISNISYK